VVSGKVTRRILVFIGSCGAAETRGEGQGDLEEKVTLGTWFNSKGLI